MYIFLHTLGLPAKRSYVIAARLIGNVTQLVYLLNSVITQRYYYNKNYDTKMNTYKLLHKQLGLYAACCRLNAGRRKNTTSLVLESATRASHAT